MAHLTIILLMLLVHSSLGFLFSSGTVTSDDYFLVGEQLNITCSLTDTTSWTPDNLYFTRSLQTVANGGTQCVDSRYISRLDSASIVISIPNVTLAYKGTYFCKTGNKACGDDDEMVDSTDIFIQYAPQNVTNIRCFIYNWNKYMNCSWQHPVPYETSDPRTLVSVSENSSSLCSGELLEACHWNKETFQIKDAYSINITIYNTQKNVFATQIATIHRLENVKPAPVENLTVRELQDGCLKLSWQHSSTIEKIFQVVLKINDKSEFQVQSSNLTDSSYQICDVERYSVYTFCVSCFPSGAKGFWSDSHCTNITPTLLVPPPVGPTLTNNSYVASSCVNGYREIQVYWQKPDVKTNITNYLVKCDGKILADVKADKYTAAFQLNCNRTNIWLEIAAANEMGQSKSPSHLLILQDLEVPDKVKETFSVDLNVGPRAHWEPDPYMNVTYNLHWCKSESSICKEEIFWKTIAWPNTSYIVPNLDDPGGYMFGISIFKGGKYSAIYWTDCLFPIIPATLPEPSVQVDVFDTYAKITYSMRCSYQNRITAFLIQYCETPKCNDSNHVKTHNSPIDVTKYTIEPLLPETFYQIMVQAKSDGVGGRRYERRVKTLALDRSVQLNWIIAAVLTPCLCFFIVLAAVISFRKCHQSKLKTAYYVQNIETGNDFQKLRLCKAYDSNESIMTLKVSTQNSTSNCTVDNSIATYCKVANGSLSKNESEHPLTEQQAPLQETPDRATVIEKNHMVPADLVHRTIVTQKDDVVSADQGHETIVTQKNAVVSADPAHRPVVTEENNPVPAEPNLDLHLTQDKKQFVLPEMNVVQVNLSCQEKSPVQVPGTPPATDDYVRQIM